MFTHAELARNLNEAIPATIVTTTVYTAFLDALKEKTNLHQEFILGGMSILSLYFKSPCTIGCLLAPFAYKYIRDLFTLIFNDHSDHISCYAAIAMILPLLYIEKFILKPEIDRNKQQQPIAKNKDEELKSSIRNNTRGAILVLYFSAAIYAGAKMLNIPYLQFPLCSEQFLNGNIETYSLGGGLFCSGVYGHMTSGQTNIGSTLIPFLFVGLSRLTEQYLQTTELKYSLKIAAVLFLSLTLVDAFFFKIWQSINDNSSEQIKKQNPINPQAFHSPNSSQTPIQRLQKQKHSRHYGASNAN